MWKYWAEEQVSDGRHAGLRWQVGFDNGRETEQPVDDYETPEKAQTLVNYLNGNSKASEGNYERGTK